MHVPSSYHHNKNLKLLYVYTDKKQDVHAGKVSQCIKKCRY